MVFIRIVFAVQGYFVAYGYGYAYFCAVSVLLYNGFKVAFFVRNAWQIYFLGFVINVFFLLQVHLQICFAIVLPSGGYVAGGQVYVARKTVIYIALVVYIVLFEFEFCLCIKGRQLAIKVFYVATHFGYFFLF